MTPGTHRRLIIQGSKCFDPDNYKRHPESIKFFREPKRPLCRWPFQVALWIVILVVLASI
jgi:hypothetical protein